MSGYLDQFPKNSKVIHMRDSLETEEGTLAQPHTSKIMKSTQYIRPWCQQKKESLAIDGTSSDMKGTEMVATDRDAVGLMTKDLQRRG